jgi:serine protease AprX
MVTRRTGNPPASSGRNGERNAPKPDTQNPFQHIPFDSKDLRSVEGGGGGSTEFVPVDTDYREALALELEAAVDTLRPELLTHTHAMGALVFRLRDKAIAKSHRPLKLVEESGLVPAGHERVEEMLVGAQTVSLAALRQVILERDIQAIRANLSSIQHIQAWSRARRNPEGTVALRERGTALMRPFRYLNDASNVSLFEAIKGLLSQHNLRHRFLRYGRGNWFVVRLLDLENASEDALDALLSYPGVRRVHPEPMAHAVVTAGPRAAAAAPATVLTAPAAALPVVGVFDTGVSARAAQVRPWITSSDVYVLPPDTDFEHGTNVASLVAGAHALNSGHEVLPPAGALVHDVCGLESGAGSPIGDLITRLEAAIKKRPDIRVWNLSLGAPSSCDEHVFSDFAQWLDQLSDQHNVLFVVAAGNYVSLPRRTWPPTALVDDRVSSPADSMRALTVGSVCHLDGGGGMGRAGDPAAYSRRGPGPVFTPKPDIVHAGGDVHAPWTSGASSIAVVAADNSVMRGFGTSYAAPIASSMAAHAWQALAGHTTLTVTPALVKGLMIHAAQLSSAPHSPHDRRYLGAGLPQNVVAGLYDQPDSSTLVFEASLVPGMWWRKAPYPVPAGLLRDGKLVGEVIITAVYAPPLDANAGAEYVRANVELSFGVLKGTNITGKVPMKGEEGTDGYESVQVEHGGKWAPVKIHRKTFPQGVSGDAFGLQARVFMRAHEPNLSEGLRVYIFCTLRSLDGNLEIHADGLRALAAGNWVRHNLPVRVPVQV